MVLFVPSPWRIRITGAFAVCVITLATANVLGKDVLVNGGFEAAGPHGSAEIAPGWTGAKSVTVIGTEGWWQDSTPFDGNKAVGVASHEDISEGTAEQRISLKPGQYKIVITGHGWVFDTLHGDGLESYLEVRLLIDGRLSQTKKYTGPGPKEWFTIRKDWKGKVNSSITLQVHLRGDGRGADAWGMAVTDDWSVEVVKNPPSDNNLFVNGGFELAGPVESFDMGTGWISTGKTQVFTFGTIKNYIPGFGPYDGEKAAGVIACSVDESGKLSQTVRIKPGNYTLTLTGHIFMRDNFGGDALNSHCDVFFRVDNRDVQYKRVYCGSLLGPGDSWGTVKWTWTGSLKESAGVEFDAQARGSGDLNSWGLCVFDGWSLTAEPIKELPEESSRFVNGDFEMAGAPNSTDLGPGWKSEGSIISLPEMDFYKLAPAKNPYPILFRVHPNYYHLKGPKAAGVFVHQDSKSGTLEQMAALKPGEYELILTGYALFWTSGKDSFHNPGCHVHFKVDGQDVENRHVFSGQEEIPDMWWSRIRMVWRGRVEREAGVSIQAEVRAPGDEFCYGLAAFDDWTLLATPVTQHPPAPVVSLVLPATRDRIHARWTFVNAPASVVQYQLAIGNGPGGTEVLPWTDMGLRSEINRCGLALVSDSTCTVSVRALLSNGFWSGVGVSEPISFDRQKENDR